jgi:arylsulfatase A
MMPAIVESKVGDSIVDDPFLPTFSHRSMIVLTLTRRIYDFALLWMVLGGFAMSTSLAAELPNVVLFYIDDMGYADIGPFGAKAYPTPNLDRMAREGRCFTDFHVSSAVCSASRVALMTGCYHERVSISGALGPTARIGISDAEMTLGEVFKQKNYATACFGKWHLGHHPKFLPVNHGFDRYFGLPYSNDMWPNHPQQVASEKKNGNKKSGYPKLPMVEQDKVVDSDVTADDQTQLTTQYTEKAVSFIREHQKQPFFIYVPHSMVHVPLYVSDKFKGKSGAGLFGDVVMEVDWSVGEVLRTLGELGLDNKTLVIFSTDNGPWLSYGDHAGSAGPHREGKGTAWEGGIRVPTLMRWPGHIPPNSTCDELACTVDILPTLAKLIDAKLPSHQIDGRDISGLMLDDPAKQLSPHETLPCYYAQGELQAIRDRQWKLVFPHNYRSLDGKPGGKDGIPAKYTSKKSELELYDMKNDRGETRNVAAEQPDVVARLTAAADEWRKDLGDSLRKQKGSGVRPHGTLAENDPVLVW